MKKSSSLTLILKYVWEISKAYMILNILNTIVSAAIPLVVIIFPAMIIDELLNGFKIIRLLYLVAIAVFSPALLILIQTLIKSNIQIKMHYVKHKLDLSVNEVIMRTDYENLEKTSTHILLQKLNEGQFQAGHITSVIEKDFFGMLENLVKIIIYIAFILRLINTDSLLLNEASVLMPTAVNYIASNTLVFICLLIVSSLIRLFYTNWYQKKKHIIINNFMNVERAYAYYVELRTDYQNGVDIRINNMFSLLLSKINSYNKNEKNLHFTVGRNNCISEIISNIISGIQLVTIYSFIVCKVFVGSISISGFYLYTNILIQFIDTVTQIMIHYSNMHNAMNYYCAYPEMWDLNKFSKKYCQISNTESRNTERNIAIEFSNVTFYYPGTTKTVLKDISFQIEYNSHVSIVGRNGAGKSTIIKLMLGLYEPQKGSIFINGINIKTMDKKDILNYFSVVFQDFKLLANTVSSNIATSDVYDLTKIMSIIEEVGLADRLSSYEMLNTEVSRHLSNEGVEFSGGEKTKIAIARALYRDSSFLVMDEPTASLDPLSEEKIFRLLEKLAEKRTTITISHRLSSCRNSDNILVLSDGSIIEEGTHDKLVKIGGLYSLMWNSQAEYYNGVCVDDND